MNDETGHYDIYAKVEGAVVLLDDTTVDLSAYAKTAEVTAAISSAINGLNIDQYATDTELNAAIARITAVEELFDSYYTKTEIANLFASYYTKAQVDAELAKKMNISDMGTYATDAEVASVLEGYDTSSEVDAKIAAAQPEQATDTEVSNMLDEVFNSEA